MSDYTKRFLMRMSKVAAENLRVTAPTITNVSPAQVRTSASSPPMLLPPMFMPVQNYLSAKTDEERAKILARTLLLGPTSESLYTMGNQLGIPFWISPQRILAEGVNKLLEWFMK